MERSPGRPIKELFAQKSWHLEPSILEEDVVVKARNFLASRLEYLRAMFERWAGASLDDAASYARHQQRRPAYESRGLPKDLRHFLTGEFDLETRLDGRITELLSTERCRNFICEFLKTDQYYIHYPPMIRFKIADAPSNLVPVHQDLAYNDHLVDFVTIWVPLVDIDEECGGIIAYAGSHRINGVPHEASGAWANRATVDLSKYPAHHIIMRAGDALLFPPTLLHESAPHRSAQTRYSIDFRVFMRESDTMKSHYDPFTGSIRRVG